MTYPSHYWTLRILADPSNSATHISSARKLTHVQTFFQTQFPQYAQRSQLSSQQNREIQTILLSQWLTPISTDSSHKLQALAGLCLRCYISHEILQSCQDLVQQFGERYGFHCQDLFPLVLTDDGRTLIVIDQHKAQFKIDRQGQLRFCSFPLFSVEILAKFNPKQSSLSTWTKQLTRRHSDLQKTLWIEYHCLLRTSWAILNHLKKYQYRLLSARECSILEAYYQVYRRDRRGKRGRCPDPSAEQLAEMMNLLSQQKINFNSEQELLTALLNIADRIRMGMVDSTQEWTEQSEDSGVNQLMGFLTPHVIKALAHAIPQEISKMVTRVKNSSRYCQYGDRLISALKLIYCHHQSQREMVTCLRMESQSQVSRVLKLNQFINGIRYSVVEQLVPITLEYLKLDQEQIKQSVNPFNQLIKSLEEYVDEVVFNQALKEIRAGKNRKMESLLAQQMCLFLKQYPQGD